MPECSSLTAGSLGILDAEQASMWFEISHCSHPGSNAVKGEQARTKYNDIGGEQVFVGRVCVSRISCIGGFLNGLSSWQVFLFWAGEIRCGILGKEEALRQEMEKILSSEGQAITADRAVWMRLKADNWCRHCLR